MELRVFLQGTNNSSTYRANKKKERFKSTITKSLYTIDNNLQTISLNLNVLLILVFYKMSPYGEGIANYNDAFVLIHWRL